MNSRQFRRDIHAHPELAFNELRTAELVARELTRYGLEVDCGLAGTGVVGVPAQGQQHTCDWPACRHGCPAFAGEERLSRTARETPGRMHACGHDGHTTILLGAARYLAEHRDDLDFDGTRLLHLPARRGVRGRRRRDDRRRSVRQVSDGCGVWPAQLAGNSGGRDGGDAGPVMAGTCTFEISVRGHGCHAAMPHQGVDTLVVASQLVLALQTVVARNLHPCESAVVSVTQIHAGEAWNIIPDDAVLRGTIRSFNADTRNSSSAPSSGCALASPALSERRSRCASTIAIRRRSTACAESEVCRQVATRALLGPDKVRTNELPSMGAEDFAYMLREKPGCYVWLGNGPGTGGCTLHNPHYDFNDEILPLGVSYWVRLVRRTPCCAARRVVFLLHSCGTGASMARCRASATTRARRHRCQKMAGSARCSIQALPEFGPKPELQDHKKENSMRSLERGLTENLRARPDRESQGHAHSPR
jgi:amidohydrolase